jgi:hypothetical protein
MKCAVKWPQIDRIFYLRKSLNKDRSEGLIFDAFESALKVINNQSTSSYVPLAFKKIQNPQNKAPGSKRKSTPAKSGQRMLSAFHK